MDMGGHDQLEIVPDRSDDPNAWRERLRTVRIVLLVVALALASWFAWNRTHQNAVRLCTLAGAIDTPHAATPDGAFQAWWATQGPEQVRYWSSSGHVAPDGIQPTRIDFTRLDEDTWEWRYADNVSIGVDVGTPIGTTPDGTWAVIGVNQCSYGAVDGRGGT